MSMTIDAVYEGGSFRPARPLPLTEHQRVRLTVEAMPMESALPEDPILAQLTALTQRLFGGDVKALRKSDPEIPGEQFVAFYATATGSREDIAAKEDAWHKDLLGIVPQRLGEFRLVVLVR